MNTAILQVRAVGMDGAEVASATATTNAEAEAKARELQALHPDATVRFQQFSENAWPYFGRARWVHLAEQPYEASVIKVIEAGASYKHMADALGGVPVTLKPTDE